MGVGRGSIPRPGLRNTDDVLLTLKNLCFAWVGFHSHSFSIISLGTYAPLRPTMLKKPIPTNMKEWSSIVIGEELPDAKILMETGKLNEATTQRDPDNLLMDNIRRQAETAAYLARRHRNNEDLALKYKDL